MDFGSVLHVAQKNDQTPKKEIKYYSTKFEPPKKEERSKQLSSNIKRFLARKEAEEKQRAVEAKREKEKLLALRSQDKKATRRVAVMLKRTKSANKSVIQDAVDNDNTAVTLAGPSQPDEDDYGYVSQEASAFYNKMMEKYSNMPEEDKFARFKKNTNMNLSGTKDRVRAALLREQEEALLPHKRKRKPKDGDTYNDSSVYEEDNRIEEKPAAVKQKPRPPPPVMNFNELLKIAEKKQFEPIKIERKVEVDDGRPMTKKQKKEFEKERDWRDRKEKGLVNGSRENQPNVPSKSSSKTTATPPSNKIPKIGSNNPMKIPKVPDSKNIPQKRPSSDDSRFSNPKKNDDRPSSIKRNDDRIKPTSQSNSSFSDRKPDPSKMIRSRPEFEKNRSLSSNGKPISKSQNSNIQNTNRPPINNREMSSSSKNLVKRDDKIKQLPPSDLKPKQLPPSDLKPKQYLPSDLRYKQLPPSATKKLPPSDLKPKQFPPSDLKPKQFPPSDLKPKQFPPSDLKPKQFPPPDLKPKRFPPSDVKRKQPPPGRKRRVLDSDSEYDSEMDDFIDDGPEGGADYSKYISEIFGYDKSRYRHEDDDDNMESSFSQMMKEEFISSKLGLLEDLEDMRIEAEQKKRKAMVKKVRK